jgi:hypothetical protein
MPSCAGRVRLSSDVKRNQPGVRYSARSADTEFSTQLERGAVVRYDANAGQRNLDLLRWGLIPYANIKMTPRA